MTRDAPGRGRSLPGTGLGDLEPGPGEVFLEPLVVLEKTTELELGHGLSASTAGAHGGRWVYADDGGERNRARAREAWDCPSALGRVLTGHVYVI
jgi:hypothetical protein